MHAGRIVSQKRKQRLESRRRSRLNSGLPNTDLSLTSHSTSRPWFFAKWIERKKAFASAKSARGLSLFHLFGSIGLIGVGLILLSISIVSVPGLLEIGVSIFLLSLFCLIFVRCDEDKLQIKQEELVEDELDDVVIETHNGDPDKQLNSSTSNPLSTNPSELDESQRDEIRAYLLRSNPRNIPFPMRGYIQNCSPITECSEPSSFASSYLIKSYEISKLAKSQTNDSLRSGRGGLAGTGISGTVGGSPIQEEDHEYDHEIDHKGKEDEIQSNFSNTPSFDTEEDSVTADISVMTVIERKGFANKSSLDGGDEDEDATPRGSFDVEEEADGIFETDYKD